MDTESKLLKEANPDRPLLAINLLEYFGQPTMDLIYNSSTIAIFSFGLGLATKLGLEGSLHNAQRSAKEYAISSCFYSVVNAILKNLTGDATVVNAALAGCCTGIFRNSLFEFQHSNLKSCVEFGMAGLIDFGFNSRDRFFSKIPKTLSNLQTNIVRSSSYEKTVKILVMTATIGSIIAHGVDLKLWKGRAPDIREFCVVNLILLASSSLLISGLHHKNVITESAVGCWAYLIFPEPFDGINDVLYSCYNAGTLYATVKAIYSRGSFFPRFPQIENKLYDGGVLPPFTILLPRTIEDGFPAFHKALKQRSKKLRNP